MCRDAPCVPRCAEMRLVAPEMCRDAPCVPRCAEMCRDAPCMPRCAEMRLVAPEMCRDAPCVPRCAEMCRDVKNIYDLHILNLAVAIEHRKCPRFAPRARNSPRVPRFALACPRFASQRHRVMTNLSTHFPLSPSLEIPFPFSEPSSIYIYINLFYFYLFNFLTPLPMFWPA